MENTSSCQRPSSLPLPLKMASILALLAGICAYSASGQQVEPWQADIASGSAYTVAPQADGKILVGGQFSAIVNQICTNITRLLPEGTFDNTFKVAADHAVYSLCVQEDDKILVGGSFTNLLGTSGICRLNPNGTLDVGFNASTLGTVYAAGIQNDNRIIVCGSFTNISGQPSSNIARLNPDGSLDSTFNCVADGPVLQFTTQLDGKLVVAGQFTALNGVAASGLGRLNSDGTTDTNFALTVSGSVGCLACQWDGKILIGGTFTNINGQSCSNVVRLNSDGSTDITFQSPATSPVTSLARLGDGKILASGMFPTPVGYTQQRRLAMLNTDGSIATNFFALADGSINAAVLQPSGRILVFGTFNVLADAFGSASHSRLGRFITSVPNKNLVQNGDTLSFAGSTNAVELWRTAFDASLDYTNWVTLGSGVFNGSVWQFSGTNLSNYPYFRVREFFRSISGRSTWYAQSFWGTPLIVKQPVSATTNYGSSVSFSIAVTNFVAPNFQWYKDGQAIPSATQATLSLGGLSGNNAGNYWAVLSNSFGVSTSAVATLTVKDPFILGQSTLGVTPKIGQNTNFNVVAAGTLPLSFQWRQDGAIIAGATSSSLTLTNIQMTNVGMYDVVVSNRFTALTSSPVVVNIDGTSLDPKVTSASGQVYAMDLQQDGKILVGGLNFIRRMNPDGTTDSTFSASANNSVFGCTLQRDQKVLVNGWFTTLSGASMPYLGRLNTDGSLDTTFQALCVPGGSFPGVYCVTLQSDSKIIVGGGLSGLAGFGCTNIGRLNPDGSRDVGFGAWANDLVYSLAVQPDGKVLVAGAFTTLCGHPHAYLGRLNSDGTVDDSFNPSADSTVISLAIQPDSKILVAGGFFRLCGDSRASYFGRINADGTLDTTFFPTPNSTVRSVALQADGTVILGGDFYAVAGQNRNGMARVRGNGVIDPIFAPTISAGTQIYALTLQPDGRVLAGGSLGSVDGQSRFDICRLINNTLASEQLNFDTNSITWLRSGSAPELSRVTFDVCTNGVDLLPLPPPQRISGGWRISGLNLPTNATIRARGFVQSGRYQGSGWFEETGAGPLVITTQPASVTNSAGTTVNLTVEAEGSGLLSYQWFKDGTPLTDNVLIAGTKTASLLVKTPLAANAGNYTVVLSNASSVITSAVATVTILDPAILSQPVSLTNSAGTQVNFSASFAGTSVSYRWYKDGTPLNTSGSTSGTGSSTLTINGAVTTNAGQYSLVLSNSFGMVTSQVATLTVIDPFISASPTNQNASIGQTVAFSITAAGTSPFSFQWRHNGALIDGATGLGLSLTNVQAADAGLYDCFVTNSYGTATSAVAMLSVNAALVVSNNLPTDGAVNALVEQSDGGLIIAGSFQQVGGQSHQRCARIKADGTVDAQFAPAADQAINCMLLQTDGRLIVAGNFTTLNGISRSRVGRLFSDGTIDPSFGTTANGSVDVLAGDASGKTIVGGLFTNLNGNRVGYIGRLNADGTLDTNFVGSADSEVRCATYQQDGKILIGGTFATVDGTPHSHIGRLTPDGRLDVTFNPVLNGNVNCFAIQPDGNILAGGEFTTVNGVTVGSLARLKPDGALDATFAPLLNSYVYSICLQADGSMIVGGSFSKAGAIVRMTLARLFSDGTVDLIFNPGVSGSVACTALQSDGSILVGGGFNSLNNQPVTNFARLINTSPATNQISYDGAILQWIRSGTAPEMTQVVFEQSQDGINWQFLGFPARTSLGWQLPSSGLLSGLQIRGRGPVLGGDHNGTTWWLSQKYQLPLASIITGDAYFGFSTNGMGLPQFGYSVTGTPGNVIIIEGSTNLIDWIPLTTNTLSSGPLYFTDPDPVTNGHRFYRVRVQ